MVTAPTIRFAAMALPTAASSLAVRSMGSGDREAGAAAAGGDGIGIADLEGLTDQVVDEVDLRPAQEFLAERIDQHGGIVLAEHQVVRRRGFLDQVVFVLEARAA